MGANGAGEMTSLLFMSVALGMDAFSVSLGMGMQSLRLKRIFIIGLIVGFFHILMPFCGIFLGKVISLQIGNLTTLIASLLLILIGSQMIFQAFNHEGKRIVSPAGIGVVFFAISVSIDSFSVGLSLGMSGVRTAIALFLFGLFSMVLTWSGMLLGKKVHGLLGVYGELLGGSILCGFGLNLLFG